MTPREQWIDKGIWLRSRAEHAAWDMGDWLIEGDAFDADFRESLAVTGYSRSHLHNLKRVAAAFEPHVRSYNLSVAAHILLLRVDDEEERLALHAQAIKEHWTVDRMKERFQAHAIPVQPRAAFVVDRPRVREGSRRWQAARVCCPQCQHVFPIRGHKVLTRDD